MFTCGALDPPPLRVLGKGELWGQRETHAPLFELARAPQRILGGAKYLVTKERVCVLLPVANRV